MKFTMFIATHNFEIDTADKGTQMRLRELQWYAVLNRNLVIFQCHFHIYIKEHGFQKKKKSLCLPIMCDFCDI